LKGGLVVTWQKIVPEANRELDLLNQLAWDRAVYARSTSSMMEATVMNAKMRAITRGRIATFARKASVTVVLL
jgi:hypothetical protein